MQDRQLPVSCGKLSILRIVMPLFISAEDGRQSASAVFGAPVMK